MQTFKITKHLTAVCESQGTRYGFRHLAHLTRDGYEIGSAKACYYNRTWERYEFESVLKELKSKAAGRLSKYELGAFKRMIDNGGKAPSRELKTVAMVAALGDIFAKDKKGANDWKARMLKAGLANKGLIMPEDWDTLSEEDKEKRLNAAIAALA